MAAIHKHPTNKQANAIRDAIRPCNQAKNPYSRKHCLPLNRNNGYVEKETIQFRGTTKKRQTIKSIFLQSILEDIPFLSVFPPMVSIMC